MRKLVLSFVALLSLTIAGQAANTISFETKSATAKSLGNNKDTIPTFKLGPVTFLTDNSGSTVYKNGWIRNDSTWVLYRDHGNGPLNVKADEGYWIKDLTMTYYENSYGILSTVAGASQSKNPLLASNYPILFNSGERQFYVGKTRADGGGFICISNFTVTYFLNPTAIALEDMTVSLGNQFQMIPTFSPAKSFAWCEWKSDNDEVVAIDKNGVINAKATGKAIITATLGSLSATCEVSVVDNSKDKSVVEDFSGHGTINDYTNSVNKLTPGTSGFSWGNRNIRRSANDMIDGKQGVSLQYRVGTVAKDRDKNYFAYADAKQEGGVKRISFQWRAIDSTKNVMFQIDDCVNNPITFFSFYPASAENLAVHTLTQDVNFAKNFQFRVKLSDIASSNVVFGPMTITPYLLYTTKTAEANGKYTNKDLINNTPDTATVVYSLEGNEGEASIDAATGEVTCLAEGEVTVRATWGAVSTTYTLKTHVKKVPEISFAAEVLNKDIFDAPFTNALTTTAGVGDTTYTSSDTAVATVDAKGQVTILAGGTTTITASLAATATYSARSASYVLNVDFTPQEGAFWEETFSKVPAVKNYTGTDKYVGDSSVYNWAMTYYQRQSDDMVDAYQGTRIRYSGALALDGVQEGGIKAFRFDYRAANQVNPIHFNVNVDGVDYEYYHAIMPVKGTIATYAQKFEVKKNTQFAIKMNAQEDPQQAYPIVGPITIAPYLLYTKKNVSLSGVSIGTTYTNTALINNAEGNVVYTVDGGSEIATINAATGEVTIQGEGTVTVQATWGDVYTTYTLEVKGIATSLQSVRGEAGVQKALVNGRIYIVRDTRMYDLQGNLLK